MADPSSPHRRAGVANLVQVAAFAVAGAWVGPQWTAAGIAAAGAAALQLVAAVAIVGWRSRRVAWWASLLTLLLVGAVMGQVAQAAVEVGQRFGSDAQRTGERTIGTAIAVLPWFVGVPAAQVAAWWRWRSGAALGLVLMAVGLPPVVELVKARPVYIWPDQPGAQAAQAAWERWNGGNPSLPAGAGPAVVLLTPWTDGRAGKTVGGRGEDLAAALSAALDRLAAPEGDRRALVLDVARIRYAGGLFPPGVSGTLGRHPRSPSVTWRPGNVRAHRVLPSWSVPQPRGGGTPVVFASWIVDGAGVHALDDGWAASPALDPDSALAAALAGGRMLARNQRPDGRFTYEVRGPSGRSKGGYNFPRHAGVTWFLTRLAARTSDPEIGTAADRALAYLARATRTLPDGRAYVRDPKRHDTRVWVGTTALAALAATERGHPLAASWGRFVASAVDAQGRVRGEALASTGTWPAGQPLNPYGHGQAILALAARVRAGDDGVRGALERAAAFVDDGYRPGAQRLVKLDEHWMCLAALATRDALGRAAGLDVCRAYLAQMALQAPHADSVLTPLTGPAGGAAEAVVAAALLDPTGPYLARAFRYGRRFLHDAYAAADAPFLGVPVALLGGFRDNLLRLDVRMDAVQHVGCALLGIEALLRGEPADGSLP